MLITQFAPFDTVTASSSKKITICGSPSVITPKSPLPRRFKINGSWLLRVVGIMDLLSKIETVVDGHLSTTVQQIRAGLFKCNQGIVEHSRLTQCDCRSIQCSFRRCLSKMELGTLEHF